MSLARSFIRGSLTVSAGAWVAYGANLLMQIAILRRLGPEDAGLYAFCFAINEFLRIVGAFSLQQALIHQRDESQSHYDTAFVVCAGIGAVALTLAALIAPVLWSARSPEAAWILLAMTAASIPRQLAQVPQAQLERALRYGAVTASSTLAAVVPNMAAVALAWGGFGAWSLALRDVLVTVVFLALSLALSPYRFRGQFSRDSFRQLMDFSKPMFVARGLEILMERLDTLVVGAWLGNRAAGIYHWGRFFSETGFIAMRPLERLSNNLYARLQDDPARLARAYGLVNTFLIRSMLTGSAVLLVFPRETVRLLLGEEWADVAPVLRWLGLYGGLYPVFHNLKVLYYGLGAVRRLVRVRIVQAVLFAALVGVAIHYDSLEGVAAALLTSTLVALGLAWHWGRELVAVSPVSLVALPALVLGATVGALLGLEAAGALAGIPWYALPFVPPVVYAAGILALEGRRLLPELRFLLEQARQAPDAP